MRGDFNGLTLALLPTTVAFMLIFGVLKQVAAMRLEAAKNDLRQAKE